MMPATRRIATGALLVAMAVAISVAAAGPASAQDMPVSQTDCVRGTFLDYHNQTEPGAPPPNHDGPWFQLSQDYPDAYPVEGDYPWLSVDVSALNTDVGAMRYLDVLFDYVTEGNTEVDWVVQQNERRGWFHAPWLDAAINGREFIHGLTHELDTKEGLLGPAQDRVTQNWAVGAYNDRGGWAFGQVWCDPMNPDPNQLNPNLSQPNSFPDGTAVFKLLFTTATDEQAPFMSGAMEWEANIFPKALPLSIVDPNNPDNAGPDQPRSNKTVRLIQIDVAVRDDRLPSGWAFATYAYFNESPGTTAIDRMVPVGLQWGNDPGVTPAMQRAGTVLTGTWINQELQDEPGYTVSHLGWAGRLSGPLDNPASSCMSCHQTSGSPGAPLVAEAAAWFSATDRADALATDRERLVWFSDVASGVTFSDTQRTSLDYSLQMSIGLQRFYVAMCDERALDEQHSGRGPSEMAPAAMAAATCSNLSPTIAAAVPAADDSSRLPWLVLVAIGLGLGVLLSQLLSRRAGSERTMNRSEHDPSREGEQPT